MENCNIIIIIVLIILFILINSYTVYRCNNTIYYLRLQQRLQYYSYLYNLNELINNQVVNSENNKANTYENFVDTSSLLLDQLNKASAYNDTNNLLLQAQLDKDKKELEKVKIGTKLLNSQNKFGVQTLQKSIADNIIKTEDAKIIKNLNDIQKNMNNVNNIIAEKNNIVAENVLNLALAKDEIKMNQNMLDNYVSNNKVPTLESIKSTIPIN
jgi:hypothetical protein